MQQQAFIQTQGLQKIYSNGQQETRVISDLNLTIHEGEFTVVMGNSGSGKSTLLYLLSGLDGATDGKIWIGDIPIHAQTEKQLGLIRRTQIGLVFQSPMLVPNLTVLENILIAGYLGTEPRELIRAKAHSLLNSLGLTDLAHRLPTQLSGGQQQRAAIVRALIHSPPILMADEPTGNLNSSASHAVLDVFSDLHAQGQTILMVTHDLTSACRGDRIIYVRDGGVIGELHIDQQTSLQDKEHTLAHWLNQNAW